ncbi:MAG: GTPase HflX [Alphaproteobacteria bacterium]|uniref:GTPase HflX n=1 Tax=PS1 clade bacterium TaxID=2175152 RepID=A0A368DK63_9PROT|nr:MAG: GTPase HflX [PS1 clade bacterium]|tara:strand:+ start:1109 stop:2374 length:1266 start_codon:yes stop_codon:yes gene_type:complete
MRYKSIVYHPNLKFLSLQKTISPEDCLEEALLLAKSLDIEVVISEVVRIDRPNNSTLLNKGRLADLERKVKELDIDLVIIDGKLTPIQQRNLERNVKVKVIDRTRLILDIFERRATTREGSLQVELAQLDYQKTRLVKSWTHLERQRGSLSFVGGPGESQLEIDKRLINDQIIKVKKKLKEFRNTRKLHRNQRTKKPYYIVALVGYTNAGKSTLFNSLTGEGVLSKDMLFATLDTKMKRLNYPNTKNIILTDTVGFISALPTELIMAFRSTLEELLYADIVINVRDLSSKYFDTQNIDVMDTIEQLGKQVTTSNYIEVLNKIDLLDETELDLINRNKNNNQILVSSTRKEGIENLLDLLENKINQENEIHELKLDYSKCSVESWLYENAVILKKEYKDKHICLKFRISKINHSKLQSIIAD